MKASILDLRYRMRDVLNALKRNEEIFYYGKLKATLQPHVPQCDGKTAELPFLACMPKLILL